MFPRSLRCGAGVTIGGRNDCPSSLARPRRTLRVGEVMWEKVAMHSPAYLFDLTDLHYAVGAGPFSGIPRVAMAYLERLLASSADLYGFTRINGQIRLLDRQALADYADHLAGRRGFPPASLAARIKEWPNRARAQSLTFLKRRAKARCRPANLPATLARVLPQGFVWLAVAYTNFSAEVFSVLRSLPHVQIAVMIHDTIPADFPDFFEKDAKAWFMRRLAAVSAMANLVIYNSQDCRLRSEFHFGALGRVPPGIVAHLGMTPLRPDMALLPPSVDFDRPSFVILGTIEPRKNHTLLLDIWERFAAEAAAGDPRPMPQLLILGRRGWRNADLFRRLDASPQKGVHIHEIADLPDGGVAAVLTKARALLFPSVVEGFGLPALEAALLRCPVIANDLVVYREFLGDLPAYAPISDAGRWADLIRQAAGNPAPERPALPPALPTWEAHFAKVFQRLDQMRVADASPKGAMDQP